MDIARRLATLKKWFELYDDFMVGYDLACGKGCASCCTCNVTATTLEALLIYEHLTVNGGLEGIESKAAAAPARRYQPAITINQMVEICLNDLKMPEETNDPGAGACLWLDDDACSIYAVRPFGCRAMCSLDNCKTSGEANMPPVVLSANNVMMQFIEALDRPGGSGNMADVLQFFTQKAHHQGYINGTLSQFPAPLKPNIAFQVLMLPPEHRQEMAPLVQALQQVAKEMA